MAIEVRYHRIPTAILGIGDFLGKLTIEKGNRIRYTIYTIRFFGLKMGYTPKRNGHRHQLNRAEAAAQVSLPRPIGHAQPEVEGLEQWPYDTVCWPLSWICWRWCGDVAYFANGTSTTWGIHRNVFLFLVFLEQIQAVDYVPLFMDYEKRIKAGLHPSDVELRPPNREIYIYMYKYWYNW